MAMMCADLVGLIVGISNSMNSFVLPTLIYMRVRYREKNEGFVSVYDLKEQRDEDARRERREKRKRDAARAAKTAKKKRQQRRQSDDGAVDDDGGGDGQGLDEEGGGAEVKAERRGLFSGRRPAYGVDSNGDAEGDGDSAGPSGNGDGDDDGGDGDGSDGGQQQYRAREDSEARRDSGTKWLLWMQQTSQGRRGNERRSGVRYWVREAAHWAFHSLIVVFGLAMGVLTTVQAFQTVIADYS